jgi:ketosteroid isomerase-like protein
MKNALYSLVVLILVAACDRQEAGGFSETDIKEIKRVMLEYREAWKVGDSANVLDKVSDDVILFMPSKLGRPRISKDSVAAFWFPPSDVSYPITEYEVTEEKIEGSGNLCIYSGVSKLTWHIQRGSVHSDTTTSVSEFLNVLRKEENDWKLYRVMYNLKDTQYK